MSQTLTDEQIAALVEAAKRGQLAPTSPERTRRSRRVREIDFSRPTKFNQEQQRRVERGHEGFCRAAATQLSAELRTPIELAVLNVNQLTWLSALAEIPQPSVYAVVSTEPLGTKILLSSELMAVRRLVTRLLGGADPGRQTARSLTDVELALTKRLFATLLGSLSLTWNDLLGLGLSLQAVETQQQSIQLAPPSEPSLAITIELREQGASSTLSLIVPYRAIEQVADRLHTGPHYGEPSAASEMEVVEAAALRSSLASVEVELCAEIAAVEMTVDDVLALQPGDVLRLGGAVDAGTVLLVEGRPLYRGRPGRSRNRRAVLVLERLERVA